MKKHMSNWNVSDDIRFKTTDYVVDNIDSHALWERWSHRYGVEFEQDNPGFCASIGEIDKRPIAVTVFWNLVGGNKLTGFPGFRVAVVEGTSQLVDYEMIEEWEKAVFPCLRKRDGMRNRHSNGSNFGNLVGDMRRRLKDGGKPEFKMRDPWKVDQAIESVPLK
jgi:hypothetical protein